MTGCCLRIQRVSASHGFAEKQQRNRFRSARAAASSPFEPASPDQSDRFARVIGEAAIALWGNLPRAIQEQLFERAVVLGHRSERDEMLREQLAKFLHDHHRRTTGSDPRRE